VVVTVLVLATGAWWVLSDGDDLSRLGSVVSGSEAPGEDGPTPPASGAGAGTELVLAAAGPVVLEGRVGDQVPLEVRVRDGEGLVRAGVGVRFTAATDGVLLEPDSVTTDSLGLARTGVRLPSSPGSTDVTATLSTNPEARVRFQLETLPGVPASLVAIAGGGQEGAPDELLTQPLGVRVTDAEGNPVPSAVVVFQTVSGGGQVQPARVQTDALGRASARWRLGPGPGTQTVRSLVDPPGGVEAVNFEAFSLASPVAEPTEPVAGDLVPSARDTMPPLDPGAGARDTGPAPASTVRVPARASAVGGAHVCRTGGGGVACRGANDRGQSPTGPAPSPLVFVATGVSHTCGLDRGGEAFCWGANEHGQLGDGSRTDRRSPVPVSGGAPFQLVTGGLSHTCALDGAGSAWCWGRNVGGQLGSGSRDDRVAPGRVIGDVRFRTLAAGWNHTCGIDTGGTVWCWGLNGDGQLGDGTHLDRLLPSRIAGTPPFQMLSAGNAHTCGIAGGDVLCWGDNQFGQLGTGDGASATRPAVVVGLPAAATRVAAGALHTCALLDDGQVFCWGQNLLGQLGDGTTVNRPTPTVVGGRFRTLDAGGAMTCGVAEDGGEFCWGLNQAGQLGDGTRTNRVVPTRVGG
jgi:hypothetical protein